ncbi:DB module, partial [Ancylostoma ceylanicum]
IGILYSCCTVHPPWPYSRAHASELSRKSTPSEVLHFSTSVSDRVGVTYTSTVYVPQDATKATLACRLKMGVGAKMHMVWEKKIGSTYRKVDGSRFKITTYASEDGPTVLVSALDIRAVDSSDFGTYKCHVRGNGNDYGEVSSLRGVGQAIPDPLPMRLAYLVMLVLYGQASAHIESCCRNRGVSETCSRALCRLDAPPGDIERYTIFEARTGCAHFLPEIAECIVDGRDSTECCRTNAVQADESSCLGLCRGSPDGVNHWIRYQSCLAINLPSMYSCILSSHSNTPTAPQLMKIVSKTRNSVEIQWSAPAKYSELVHIYKVHVTETSGSKHEEVIHSTKQFSIALTNLKPDGKYSIFVVAHASELSRKSTPSEVLHFSTSVSDRVGVTYTSTVYVPQDATKATLACRLKMGVGAKMHMVWEKKIGSTYRKVDGSRFKITTYASEDGPTVLVSALDIRAVDSSDFGTYKCHVRGNGNDYGEVSSLFV